MQSRRDLHNATAEIKQVQLVGGLREAINLGSVRTSSQRIARFIDNELRKSCEGPKNRVAVMEHVLGNSLVFPHFLDYYLKPLDTRI